MTLKRTLLADLQRKYYFSGHPERVPRTRDLFIGFISPRSLPVALCRLSQASYKNRLGLLARLFSLVNFILFGLEVSPRCKIDDGLFFPHTIGTVIGAQSIGRNAVIYHGVTLGAKEIDFEYAEDQRPRIGDNVIIGSGAKVLGGITIGNHVVIGANAVVLDSLPDNVLAGGVPARILRQNDAQQGVIT
jgi:serine O-acetyltransferase